MHQRRVVITGLGVLAPNGCGKEPFWQACLEGRSGIRPITRFATDDLPTRIAGNIPDFSPTAFGLTPAECTLLGRGSQLAVAAANLESPQNPSLAKSVQPMRSIPSACP